MNEILTKIVIIYLLFINRLFTSSSKSGFMYNIFTKPDDEKFHKVYKNNMAGKEDPFIGVKKGTSKILKAPNCAYIHTKHQIDWLKECGNCEIEFIPWQQLVGYNSMPMVKASYSRQALLHAAHK